MLQGRWPRRSNALALSIALFAAAALISPFAASAQSQNVTVQINGMTGDGWPQAQVVASVLSADGSTVPGLTTADLRATLNGGDVPIEAVAQGVNSDQPIDVVLALDVSGSMEGDALEQAKASALSFLEQLGPDDELAIVAFGTTVETVLPFTTDRSAAQSAIDGLIAEGSTALFQATADSVHLATSGESGRRAVVLLSDGVDFGSPILREEALATAGTGSVPFFAIGLGNEIDRAYLRDLTELTGGQFAETPTPEGLADLYQEVGELLRGQYIITLDASELSIERSAPATLFVEVTQGELTASDQRDVCAQNVCAAVAGITAGQQIEGRSTIEAQVVAVEPVTSVRLLIDGQPIETLVAPPYEFSIDAATLADGDHDIAIEAETASDSVTTGVIAVRVGAAASSSGGMASGLLPIAVIGAVGVAVVLVILFVMRRRRGRAPRPGPVAPELPPDPPPGPGARLQDRAP